MKKGNIILLVVTIFTAMVFSSANNFASAKSSKTEIVNSGLCGDSVQWHFSPDSGLLIISGKGAINNFPFPGTPTPWKRTSVDSLVIEEGITEIGDYAFYYCEKIKSIKLPNSLTRIGAFAFTGCKGLDSLEIPASVRYIEHSAFCYCRNIKSLKIQSDSIDIASFAFGFCDNLKRSAYSYMANGRHISHCAFHKEFNDDSAAKKEEEHDEKIDSLQIPTDSTKLKLFEKLEIVTPTL